MTGVSHLVRDGAALAFRHRPGAGPLIVFLPGYMSDMTGSKAEALDGWAEATGRAYLRLDYSGCGASGGEFLAGSIGRWTADALAVIDHVAPAGPVLLVGSSMGGWIALRAGLALGARLAGLVGIAAAPDFTDWGLELTDADRAALAGQGWFTRPSDYDPGGYRYSRALIEDAPAQRLLHAPIAITAPVRLLHGQRDDAVPWRLSLDIADRLHSGDVQVTLVKDGDHRLSGQADIALLTRTVAALAGNDG
jgi:pimeloyl-ACP methyl ester carboxylesterase